MSSTLAFLKCYCKLVDWRLVAAVALPVWTFIFGMLVAWKPASSAAPSLAEVALIGPTEPIPPPPAIEVAPEPREVVVRSELVPMPIVVPVVTPADPLASASATDFKLPASELMPADRCKTFDTKIRFHPTVVDAADESRKAKKMLFVLHLSGDFDDPGFT
ncbi:MAG: hypothetical protein L0241_13235 [Planctomycetia bacterium]|nr:hypothetical protein [Planctomycetia bacterium]